MNNYIKFSEKDNKKVMALLKKEGIAHQEVKYLGDEFVQREVDFCFEEHMNTIEEYHGEYKDQISLELFISLLKEETQSFIINHSEHYLPGTGETLDNVDTVLRDELHLANILAGGKVNE